ncbi:MAG: tRNA lysidine(34) synthetase TilS [spirochete symbiont of Stewartia floridana]|nr:MAG: tRNA lysidine(34) synthetase TilS [spirochete symbiont of Stewartia floridana]
MPAADTLVIRFEKVLQRQGVRPGSICLIGLSGGGDSAALVSLAVQVRGIKVCAARVSHGLRSVEEDEAERKLCRNLCEKLSIRYDDLPLPPRMIDDMRLAWGCGMEQAARKARLSRLEAHRHDMNAEHIFLGHSADDQLETMLMRLMTGSGPEGLRGIPLKHGRIIRPLLFESRKVLRDWLKERNVPWAEDSSNRSMEYRRNRVRNELIPLLSGIFPGWEKAALTLAERAKEVCGVLESVSRETLPVNWKLREGKWPAKRWHNALPYIKAMTLWEVFNRLDESHIPDRRIPWRAVMNARDSLDTSGKWTGYGISISRNEKYFTASAESPQDTQAHIVLKRKDIEDFHLQSFAHWDIRVRFTPLPDADIYHVMESDWPLILHVEGGPGSFGSSLSGRQGKISKKSAFNLCDDDSAEIVYIQVKES